MKLARSLLQGGALLLAIVLLPHEICAQNYQGRELVKAELIADTNAIVSGKPFTVGLLLKMVPGWHTYWKFPGDAGIPTELKWKLPPGWKVGEIQWPIPLKLEEPGNIQIYGYHDEVLLMQEITPPTSVTDSTVRLSAEANWLVCEKICIPGSANLQLELLTSSTAVPANTELFEKYRRSLPKAWPGKDVAATKWSRDGSGLRLNITSATVAKSPYAEFYPLPGPKVVAGHPAIESKTESEINFRIPIESPDQTLSSLNGLVVFGQRADADDRLAWQLQENVAASSSIKSTSERGIITFLFLGFVGGLILNLMPCVLPVISLKIFGFIQHAGQNRRKILRNGLAFTAGIFAWFIGLALMLILLKATGHQITWASLFTNPYFVLFMSVVVLVFGLNLLGVFEISLPQAATRSMLGVTAQEGDAGSFFQGVFATILATPCTAPYLGTALGFAFTQSPAVILAMFVAIAAGMALPYLLLSAQPAWMRYLPKPGAWMERLKQFMGFLLLATLLFLLYVLGAQRGLEAVIWTGCFLLVVSMVCWMKGAFLTPTASGKARIITLAVMSLLLVTSGAYFIGDKFRSSKLATTGGQSQGDWKSFSPDLLRAELEQGRAVFVDFTAAWCITCKFNEASVLETTVVREAFRRHGVTKIKADWTNGDPEITKLLQQFGRPGVPFYVLYPGNSQEPIVFPELLTKSIVLEKLEMISRNVASK